MQSGSPALIVTSGATKLPMVAGSGITLTVTAAELTGVLAGPGATAWPQAATSTRSARAAPCRGILDSRTVFTNRTTRVAARLDNLHSGANSRARAPARRSVAAATQGHL